VTFRHTIGQLACHVPVPIIVPRFILPGGGACRASWRSLSHAPSGKKAQWRAP